MAGVALSGTQHLLRAGRYEACIASVGASLRSLTFDGRDLVVPFAPDEVRPAFRGVTLAPWPNRVVDGRYVFDGVEQRLALTEPERGHALHGLAAWLDYEAIDKGPDHVTVRADIQAQTGYPWRVRIETRYELDAQGLTQTVRATNEADTAAPFGTGPHPYLVAGESALDEWTLELPASQVLHVTEDRLAPTALRAVDADDAARFDFRAARRIGAVELDHAFTDLARGEDGHASVRLTDASGSGVEMCWDVACGWVQVHTADLPDGRPGTRAGLAVEPMTCAPDAFNAARYPFDTGLLTVEPGATVEASWRIAAL
ncbi:aldose 1-epimerase family protein [Microbacterium caowuchunii]|uniref:aldose 1-epimerase family protein n=1 Tax=Microbacterium caowuchunii TaxID=2614638 RepID=UPI00124907B8|nr:aldose 1-epimerase family protein [Microbacterium caowuchunii]QEV99078.1 aldose 1-epimerase family protein [Microbacterium caowuchunii]